MKISLLLLFLSIPCLLSAVDISFKVENLRSDKGKVFVGIYDNPESFPSGDGYISYCFSKEKIISGKVDITCQVVKPGYYAAAMYHDENDNREFDTNLVGIPKEGYGFSNNPAVKLSPPTFKEAAFEVKDQNLELLIRMNY